MLADVEVCCATMLCGSIVPSHCCFRDRVGLPRIPQAQYLDNSMPYHINIFMNADDDGLGFDVQFCGERICYQIFYIQGDSGGKVNILRGDSVGSL